MDKHMYTYYKRKYNVATRLQSRMGLRFTARESFLLIKTTKRSSMQLQSGNIDRLCCIVLCGRIKSWNESIQPSWMARFNTRLAVLLSRIFFFSKIALNRRRQIFFSYQNDKCFLTRFNGRFKPKLVMSFIFQS